MLDPELTEWRDRLQSLPLAVCVCDSHWKIVFVNGEAANRFERFHSGQLAGIFLHDLWLPPLRGTVRDRLLGLVPDPDAAPSKLTLPLSARSAPYSSVEVTAGAVRLGNDLYWQIALHKRQLLPRLSSSSAFGLLDVIHEPVCLWRLSDGTIQYWNRAAEALYGYSAAEAVGRPRQNLLEGPAAGPSAVLIPEIEHHLRAERSWSGERTQSTCAGAEVVVETRMTLLECDGELTVVEVNRDITVRRAAEKALRFHFELNRSITDQAVDPIFVIGSSGEIIFANSEAERVFGWTPEQLLGKPLHVTLHHHDPGGESIPIEECPLWKAQVTGQAIRSLELVFFHKEGHPIPVSCSNSPFQFENGDMGAVLIIRDITEQKRMERALAESEERLRVAVASSNIGTWDLSLLSGAASLDTTCRTVLGLEPESGAGVGSWLRSVHPDDRPQAREQMRMALDPAGSGQFHLECRTLSRSDHQLRYVHALGQAFFDTENGHRKPVRLIGTLQDVTQRKRAEEALRRANQDLQQFAYAAAHDLQEPLRNVVNLLGLYKRTQMSKIESEGSDLIDLSIDDARRMHQMIRDLLSFTDVHGETEPPVSIDPGAILMDALKNLSSLVDESKADVTSDYLPPVKVRATHLLQLLQNLLSNALKYRRRGRPCEVRVGARRRGTEWVFSVADNGIGFDPAYAQRIFGVFKRLHGRYEYPGSGIGLAICARIVDIYGGRIWAEGEPGRGATFYFTLPVVNRPL